MPRPYRVGTLSVDDSRLSEYLFKRLSDLISREWKLKIGRKEAHDTIDP